MIYYYAYVTRYSKEDNFSLLTFHDTHKLAVVTDKEEAKIAFRKAFSHNTFNEGGIVNITQQVADGIIPVDKLEILELVVKRSL
ncbi:hypothetical protein J4218_01770 [Candidatus Pacearchaeota archaeon]|nr:hypothetical protein [uncultured archaeon]MBS3078826.1 hypothetical protein [Candidatus Pacearchaeota archaeon]